MPMYLNQASVYDLHVQTTVCELGCKKYNSYLFLTVQQQLYKHLCQFSVFTYTCRRKLEKASSIPCYTNKTEQKKANYIHSNQIYFYLKQ